MTLRFFRRAVFGVLVAAAAGSTVACDGSLQGSNTVVLDGSPHLIAVTPQELLAQFGVLLDTPIRVRVLDDEGRPVRSAVVKYTVLVGSGVFSADSTLTNDQGYTEVLFRPLSAGTVIIEAMVGGAGGVDTRRFTFLVLNDPSEAASLTRISGDNQSGETGTVADQPLAVRVVNPDGFPVADHPVTFVLTTSQGTDAGVAADPNGPFQSQVVVQTDASGMARAYLRYGSMEGAHVVTARTVTGLAGSEAQASVTFGATARPTLRIAQLIPISGETQTVVIDTLNEFGSDGYKGRDPNPMVVQALDAFGNPVAGAPIQWFLADGGGRLLVGQTVTNSNGVASNQLFDPTEGSNVVVAFSPTAAATATFTITGEVFVPQEEEEDDDEGGGGGGG